MKDTAMRPLITPPPVPYPPHYIIDPVAFFGALIAAPLLFTALSFWALFIPVFALFLGGPLYLVIGTPVLLWHLRHNDGDPHDLSFLAFAIMVAALVLSAPLAALSDEDELLSLSFGYFGFGMIFAPAWAYVFGRIYQHFRRDFYAKPRPF
jgi:hypothetical protein